jgi:hypothetical protein
MGSPLGTAIAFTMEPYMHFVNYRNNPVTRTRAFQPSAPFSSFSESLVHSWYTNNDHSPWIDHNLKVTWAGPGNDPVSNLNWKWP